MAAAFPWTGRDGVWRRRLGSMESFYLTLAAPEGEPVHWMVGCCVSFAYRGKNADVENTLRQAWTEFRHEFPTIAAAVNPLTREMGVAMSDDPVSIDIWQHKSFHVHSGTTADELFGGFRSQFHIILHLRNDAMTMTRTMDSSFKPCTL
ncbi:hypothetical protein MMYC01_201575 [Madurella mycetomatis]|uniref:Uncharacterized protein n=1 Tax=Madurella mycetomatis TaxID=100816 RepID=A0A175WBN8_9PEZI|nr:hypothetical protein MMYC01_201575 [Madurella mycetomatis]